MRLTKLMLVAALGSWAVVALFLAGCRTPVPVANPVYGSASDAGAALPAPAVHRSVAAPSTTPVAPAPKRAVTRVRPERRVVRHRTPAPAVPFLAPRGGCTSPFG